MDRQRADRLIGLIYFLYYGSMAFVLFLLIVLSCSKRVLGTVIAFGVEALIYLLMPYVMEWIDDIDLNAKEGPDA